MLPTSISLGVDSAEDEKSFFEAAQCLGGGAHWLCRSPRNGMSLNGGFPEAGAPPPPCRAGHMAQE